MTKSGLRIAFEVRASSASRGSASASRGRSFARQLVRGLGERILGGGVAVLDVPGAVVVAADGVALLGVFGDEFVAETILGETGGVVVEGVGANELGGAGPVRIVDVFLFRRGGGRGAACTPTGLVAPLGEESSPEPMAATVSAGSYERAVPQRANPGAGTAGRCPKTPASLPNFRTDQGPS